MIDFQSAHDQRKIDHAACQQRETQAWQEAYKELTRRQKAERHLGYWRNFGIYAVIWQVAQIVRWYMGW